MNGNGKCVYGKTRREVTGKLAKALSEVAGRLVLDRGTLTLKQYLDSWLKNSIKDSVMQITYERYDKS